MKFATRASVLKTDKKLGLVFGFAAISKVDGEDYYDSDSEHLPEEELLPASLDFMKHSRVAKIMHAEDDGGEGIIFAFPLTTEIAKALDITTKRTGLLIGMKPSADTFAKFESGEYTGFSIGGEAQFEEVVEA